MKVLQRTILLLLCWQAAGKKPVDRSYQVQGVPYGTGAQGIQFYATGGPGLIYPNIPVYIPAPVVNLQQQTDPYRYRQSPINQQQQTAGSFTIEQSVDLTHNQNLPSVPSTYGPPKTVDMPLRRPPHHRYHKHKHPSRRPLIYTHMHKGHYHTHYLPPSSQAPYKPPKPVHISPPSTEPPEMPYNHHAYPPEQQKYPIGPDVTQALIGKQPGIINNYDANLPVKIPSPKPNLHEVKDILKNAELHFVDVLENQPTTPMPQRQQSYHQEQSYQPQLYHQPSYPVAYHEDDKRGQQQNVRPYPELYDQRFQFPQGYQNNHLEDSGQSETIKIPVAVFKGVLPGMFPVERSDEETSESLPPNFTPSKRTSDWIPMTGNSPPRTDSVRTLNKFGDDFFSDLSKPEQQNQFQIEPIAQPLISEKPTKPENKIVGDIISGRIPGGHNPFGVVGKKQSATSGTVGDGSNLVVSSVIKFSR